MKEYSFKEIVWEESKSGWRKMGEEVPPPQLYSCYEVDIHIDDLTKLEVDEIHDFVREMCTREAARYKK